MELNQGTLKIGISAVVNNGRVQAIGILRINATECLMSGNSSQVHRRGPELGVECACSDLGLFRLRTKREGRSGSCTAAGDEDGDPGRTPPPDIGVNMGPH